MSMSGDFAKLITDSGRQADNVLKFSRWINYRIPISTENGSNTRSSRAKLLRSEYQRLKTNRPDSVNKLPGQRLVDEGLYWRG